MGSLVTGAPVMMADVPVGKVTGISLGTNDEAVVTMSIDRSARVPKDVTAVIYGSMDDEYPETIRLLEPLR